MIWQCGEIIENQMKCDMNLFYKMISHHCEEILTLHILGWSTIDIDMDMLVIFYHHFHYNYWPCTLRGGQPLAWQVASPIWNIEPGFFQMFNQIFLFMLLTCRTEWPRRMSLLSEHLFIILNSFNKSFILTKIIFLIHK